MASTFTEPDGVRRVVFSVMTADEIRSRAACQVESVELFSGGNPVEGGLYDTRMGVTDFGRRCATCHHDNKVCPGHPGYIELAVPVFNPLFIEYIKKILKCVCLKCARTSLPESFVPRTVGSSGTLAVGESVLAHAAESTNTKVKQCVRCGTARHERLAWNKLAAFTYQLRGETGVHTLTSAEIYDILVRIPDADCSTIGLAPHLTRPEALLFKALPVTPVSVRPPHRSGAQRRDDDITHKLSDIIKCNRRVRAKVDAGAPVADVHGAVNGLQLCVTQLIENPSYGPQQARMKATNRPLRSIASRLKGKEGRVRNNLLGKRVEFSARSVITGEPNISVDEVGVPIRIAMTLTFPETVYAGNLERLRLAVSNGPSVYPGARMIRQDGITFSLERAERRVRTDLRAGDVVERHMVDGDVVLVNRQPSLHRMSMMCHRVKVMPHDTFRLNVLAAEAYNFDFDGDETNLYLPQSKCTAIEISRLASVSSQIISPRHHRPIIGIVQDVALGTYLLTRDGVAVDANTAANICARCSDTMPSGPMTGRELFSSILPTSLHCTMRGGAVIKHGELVAGRVSQPQFQQESCGVLHSVFAEDGPKTAVKLLDAVQTMTCDWLMHNGHSMGAIDIALPQKQRAALETLANATRKSVGGILASVHHGTFVNASVESDRQELERQILCEVDKAFTEAKRIAEVEGNDSVSRLMSMVNAKSKGNTSNVGQMVAFLGQNLIDQARIPTTMGGRILPHFHRHDEGANARGFIGSCFRDGLKPHEFFFHAMAGREGLIDTAVKTSVSGYLQRRFVKALEDLQVASDGSVRDASNAVVSFLYGGDGADACAIETQTVPTFGGGLEWLAANYLVSLADSDEFAIALTPEAVLVWDRIDDIGLERLRDHFRHVVDDKHFFAHTMEHGGARLGEGRIAHALGFERIITRWARAHNPAGITSDLSVLAVLDAQRALVHELFPEDTVFRHEHSHNAADQTTRLVGAALVRAHISPKPLIRQGVTTKALADIVGALRHRFYVGRVSNSEMVGIIAAQSIAEPSTQMCLNMFHSTGLRTSKASVPRIQELVGVTKHPKTTAYMVTLLEGADQSEEFAGTVRDRILSTHVRDVVSQFQMICENGAYASKDDERIERLARAFEPASTKGALQASCTQSPKAAPEAGSFAAGARFVMRIELDSTRMMEHGVSVLDVQAAILSHVHARVVASDDASDKLIVRVEPHPALVGESDLVAELRAMEAGVMDVRVKGVDGITACVAVPEKDVRQYCKEAADYVPRNMFRLEAVAGSRASSSDLLEIATIPGVDVARTTSDNLCHVMTLFGIEAVRTLLLHEIQGAFSDSTYADFRHVELLVDFMTRRGVLTPITRHGIGATDAGPLTKCSFEQTVQKIVQAGMFGDVDKMTGVSANIMLGQTTPCGTGQSQVLWDTNDTGSILPDGDVIELASEKRAVRPFSIESIFSYTPFTQASETIPAVSFLGEVY